MSEQTVPKLTPDAAIQVRVCGQDAEGHRIDEISAAFQTPNGVMLETVHHLREAGTLEITDTRTHRKAIAQVKSLGPKLGVSTLVFLEGEGVEELWPRQSHGESGRRGDTIAAEISPAATLNMGTLVAMPERALKPVSPLRIPKLDRFMDTLSELVESALEANLRPTVEELTQEIPEHVVRAQKAVLANLDEQIQAAISGFGGQLVLRALEIVSRNETVLAERAQRVEDEATARVSQKIDVLLDRFSAELDRRFEQAVREPMAEIEKRVEEKGRSLNGVAQEAETEFAARLNQQADEIAARFDAAMQVRFDHDLSRHAARFQEQLASSAGLLRQSLMEQLANDLHDTQRKFIEQTQRMARDMADQNQTRMARLLKEMAQAMESQAEPALESNPVPR